MIEWKMKYTLLIDNVYVLKEIIDVRDGFKQCDAFSMEDVEALIEGICKLLYISFNVWIKILFLKYYYPYPIEGANCYLKSMVVSCY